MFLAQAELRASFAKCCVIGAEQTSDKSSV